MNNYSILIIGWLLGQILINAIKVYRLEKDNAALSYRDACVIVFWKGLGTFVICVVVLAIGLFLMPEFFKNVLIADDNGKSYGWSNAIVNWLRLTSVAFGMVAQHVALYFANGLRGITKRFIEAKTGEKIQDE